MHIRRLFIVLLLLCTLASTDTIHAQDTTAPIDDEFLQSMETIITDAMAQYHVPGTAVAIVRGDEIVFAKGFGVRNIETGAPVTTETLFRPGSTGKSMTSLMIATLVDDGVLSWDTPLIDIYPDIRFPTEDLTRTATIGEIMGHGTGLDIAVLPVYWNLYSPEDVLAAQADAGIAGPRGETYLYNNDLFAVAGYMAVMASGMEGDLLANYKTLMQERIFDPIGMDTFTIGDDPSQFSDDYATSYLFNLLISDDFFGLEAAPYTEIASLAPAGGGLGSITDMAKYLITQINEGTAPDGTQVVSAENLAQTWQPQTPIGQSLNALHYNDYGMGWVSGDFDGIPFLWHNGGIDGFLTEMLFLPEADTGMVILSNSLSADYSNQIILYEFIKMLYGKEDVDVAGAVAAVYEETKAGLGLLLPLLADPQADSAEITPYLGSYEKGFTLTLDEDGVLHVSRPGIEVVMVPMPTAKTYIAVNGNYTGTMIRFSDAEDGTPMMRIVGAGDEGRVQKID